MAVVIQIIRAGPLPAALPFSVLSVFFRLSAVALFVVLA